MRQKRLRLRACSIPGVGGAWAEAPDSLVPTGIDLAWGSRSWLTDAPGVSAVRRPESVRWRTNVKGSSTALVCFRLAASLGALVTSALVRTLPYRHRRTARLSWASSCAAAMARKRAPIGERRLANRERASLRPGKRKGLCECAHEESNESNQPRRNQSHEETLDTDRGCRRADARGLPGNPLRHRQGRRQGEG